MNNRIAIFGRVTKEPEIRVYTGDEDVKYMLIWTLAQYQGKDDTVFWNCAMYGEQEYLEKQIKKLHKGRRTYAEGTIFVKNRIIESAAGVKISIPVNNVRVRDITYADGRIEGEKTEAGDPGNASVKMPDSRTDQANNTMEEERDNSVSVDEDGFMNTVDFDFDNDEGSRYE